ncbi:hypothetical protein L2E82_48148 [Cichorium intybus]|uniref:Uncharacterized protein n=1 Tax=Cichorium intybus TaxID=13427 RepID=A0ACB8YXY8_CICIN|nr:hypothetical protein L2E82_48148 [Cichorium intybus]
MRKRENEDRVRDREIEQSIAGNDGEEDGSDVENLPGVESGNRCFIRLRFSEEKQLNRCYNQTIAMLRSFISSSSRSASSINSSTTVRYQSSVCAKLQQRKDGGHEKLEKKLLEAIVDSSKVETETFGKEVAKVRAELKPWEKELIEHQGKLEVASAENKLLSKKSRKDLGDECEDVVGAKQRKNSATIFVIRNGFLGGVHSVFFLFKAFQKSKVFADLLFDPQQILMLTVVTALTTSSYEIEAGNTSVYDYENIDWDTEDEIEIRNITLSSCAGLATLNIETIVSNGEASSLVGPSNSKLVQHFLGMAFSEQLIAKAIKENGISFLN